MELFNYLATDLIALFISQNSWQVFGFIMEDMKADLTNLIIQKLV